LSAVIAVAYSAGRDSTALLHATLIAAQTHPDLRVVALHVHHGLSSLADAWLAHARTQCEVWAAAGLPVTFCSRHLQLTVAAGDSTEAVARAGRYEALAEMATEQGAELVLLAHHQRDQAETLLLQALRGGGLAGMASMPVDVGRGGIRWVRPWLHHRREAIEAYVAQHCLSFVDDDSNADVRYARNRLRLDVWPALTQAFEHAEQALAHAAGRAADAQACLVAWAEDKLAALVVEGGEDNMDLDAPQLLQLELPMQRELLRHWFGRVSGRSMPSALVVRLTEELPRMLMQGRPAHWPAGAWAVSCYHGVLRCEPRRDDVAAASGVAAECVDLSMVGVYAFPNWKGSLHVMLCESGGLAPEKLAGAVLRAREGGEAFQLGPQRPVRSLRKQYQSEKVPAWHRRGPLVYAADGQLLFVPGLGVDARACEPAGGVQFTLQWIPDQAV